MEKPVESKPVDINLVIETKTKGNEEYNAGRYSNALEKYLSALSIIEAIDSERKELEMRHTINSNIAATYLKLAKYEEFD